MKVWVIFGLWQLCNTTLHTCQEPTVNGCVDPLFFGCGVRI